MLIDIVGVKPLGEYRLHLQFEDGVEGVVDARTGNVVPAVVEFDELVRRHHDERSISFYSVA